MNKTIYILNFNNYEPAISELTIPTIKHFADRIGADLFIMHERKSPDKYLLYEKFQMYDLMKDRKDDWAYFIDTDTLVHPDMFDVTELISKDTVCQNKGDVAYNRWKYDHNHRRDGRNIATANFFCVVSDWCRDFWRPLDDMTYEEAISNIHTRLDEVRLGYPQVHFLDEYITSRNVARFGLKYTTVKEILRKQNDEMSYLYHNYGIPAEMKLNGGTLFNGLKILGIAKVAQLWSAK